MELSPFQELTEAALEDCSGAVKHCAMHSLHHLRKAWGIADIDLEMAVFRGITAEEEAASSLFYTLKNQRYSNSEKLMFKEHTYKQAAFPYIMSVISNLRDLNAHNGSPFGSPRLQHIQQNSRTALRLCFVIESINSLLTPTPPLNFSVSNPDTGRVVTFEQSLKETCQGDQFSSALKYVKHIASERNRILYADAGGRPQVSGDLQAYLENQKNKVFTLLHTMLLIDPWANEGHSLIVQ